VYSLVIMPLSILFLPRLSVVRHDLIGQPTAETANAILTKTMMLCCRDSYVVFGWRTLQEVQLAGYLSRRKLSGLTELVPRTSN
jgi:hypothetical protein